MSVIDSICPPDYGPPHHVYHDADETFVILSGEVELWLEGDNAVKGPGDTTFIQRGKEHTVRVIGTQPSRHFVILTPGGFEGFVADMAAGHFRAPEDMAQIEEIAARRHLEFTGPPL